MRSDNLFWTVITSILKYRPSLHFRIGDSRIIINVSISQRFNFGKFLMRSEIACKIGKSICDNQMLWNWILFLVLDEKFSLSANRQHQKSKLCVILENDLEKPLKFTRCQIGSFTEFCKRTFENDLLVLIYFFDASFWFKILAKNKSREGTDL